MKIARRVSLLIGVCAVFGATAAALTTGCSDDDKVATTTQDSGTPQGDSGGAADTGTAATTGTITGNATYAGAKKGGLIIAVFKDQPIPGQPPAAPIAVGANDNATWPGSNTFTVNKVPAGSVWVAAFVNQPPDHRQTGAGLTDPIAMPPKNVTVVAGQTASVDLNLGDRPVIVPDGGTDGGDAGDGG